MANLHKFTKVDKIIYMILYQTCLGKYQRELSQLYHGHLLATACKHAGYIHHYLFKQSTEACVYYCQECAQNVQSGGYFPSILKLNILYASMRMRKRGIR